MNFRDRFQTVRAKFSGLFSNSPDRIFRNVFMETRTMLRFGFNLGTDVFEFVEFFGITIIC